ncbi:hypothetical protein BDV41DRAFT_244270 [Aspergillus transmontanensis]|uniref:Uncharacterized protein n=1 Tax=Aspergillus transmontanensis TaxID=1034304 RepID=A0A5N6W3Y7_9EURO|nr:hypothetical protein BDV41DRAFT_244270 [Aspergillus transmontanensis]
MIKSVNRLSFLVALCQPRISQVPLGQNSTVSKLTTNYSCIQQMRATKYILLLSWINIKHGTEFETLLKVSFVCRPIANSHAVSSFPMWSFCK